MSGAGPKFHQMLKGARSDEDIVKMSQQINWFDLPWI